MRLQTLRGRFPTSPSSPSGSRKLPLHRSAGSLWQYGIPRVLARIMELVSGKSLIEVEREKLLDPLG